MTVDESDWLSQLVAAQTKRYPNHADNFSQMKHFYIGGSDTAVEIIAEGFDWATMDA